VPDNLKTNDGKEAYNPTGIVPRAVSMIKEKFPDAIVCTDVALDPYSNQVNRISLYAAEHAEASLTVGSSGS
jgi:delta-aminolevulinic acid dehydratase/porphobilinogen synthase